MYEKVPIITQIWLRAKCYFTSMSNAWYLISVPNMNKIATFFSEISQQILKIYEKIAIITQIQQPMVPNMKKIHPVIMEECTRMD